MFGFFKKKEKPVEHYLQGNPVVELLPMIDMTFTLASADRRGSISDLELCAFSAGVYDACLQHYGVDLDDMTFLAGFALFSKKCVRPFIKNKEGLPGMVVPSFHDPVLEKFRIQGGERAFSFLTSMSNAKRS